jgi:hypothetical protein
MHQPLLAADPPRPHAGKVAAKPPGLACAVQRRVAALGDARARTAPAGDGDGRAAAEGLADDRLQRLAGVGLADGAPGRDSGPARSGGTP